MSIIKKKKEIFGNIAADKVITNGMPKLKQTSSMPSINNSGDVIEFLSDLIKSIDGYETMVDIVVETLTYYIKDIESDIRKSLIEELKSIVSCGINPSIPDYLKSTGTGIKISIDKIDFQNILKTNPKSEFGNLLYSDITPNLINSTDLNTFLYQTIQNDGTINSWGSQTLGQNNDVLTFEFNSTDINGIDPNNTLTIKAHPNYDNKKLYDLNSDFINSIKLFDSDTVLTKIIDNIFGTTKNVLGGSTGLFENIEKIDHIVSKFSKIENDDIIDDNFFNFTNDEIKNFENTANEKKNGVKTLATSTTFFAGPNAYMLSASTENIRNITNIEEKRTIISDSINKIGQEVANSSNNPLNQINNNLLSQISLSSASINSFGLTKIDHKSIKLNFIQEIINSLTKSIVGLTLSPKIYTIFLINSKIVYGQNSDFNDTIDFLKKNRNLIKGLVSNISGIIVKILLRKVVTSLTKLIKDSIIKKNADKQIANLQQLLSLLNVSPEILKQLKLLV